MLLLITAWPWLNRILLRKGIQTTADKGELARSTEYTTCVLLLGCLLSCPVRPRPLNFPPLLLPAAAACCCKRCIVCVHKLFVLLQLSTNDVNDCTMYLYRKSQSAESGRDFGLYLRLFVLFFHAHSHLTQHSVMVGCQFYRRLQFCQLQKKERPIGRPTEIQRVGRDSVSRNHNVTIGPSVCSTVARRKSSVSHKTTQQPGLFLLHR